MSCPAFSATTALLLVLVKALSWLSVPALIEKALGLVFFLWLVLRTFYAAIAVVVACELTRRRLLVPWSKRSVKNLVFISHRRVSSAWANLIRDRLATKFGDEAVFLDNKTMRPGDDYAVRINQALEECGAFLAVIETGWLNTIQDLAKSHVKDWVRLEIATILKRKVRPIPVLVGEAKEQEELSADKLPNDIRPIARRKSARVRGMEYVEDCETLNHDLLRILTRRNKFRLWTKSHASQAAIFTMIVVTFLVAYIEWVASAPGAK
jgi:hypothetical protein